MWVIIGIIVGLLAILGLFVTMVAVQRRTPDDSVGTDVTAEQWFGLGVTFIGAGVALLLTLGPAMIGMIGVGAVFVVLGARIRRDQAD